MKRLCTILILVSTTPLVAQAQPEGMIEWPFVGAEHSHTKYSPAADVTPANVDQLEVAWEWEPGEMPLPEYGTRPGRFQTTPLMIDNVLYLSTMYARAARAQASSIGGWPTGATAPSRASS